MVANNTYEYYRDVMVRAYTIDREGKMTQMYQQMADVDPASIKNCQSIGRGITSRSAKEGIFLVLKLLKSEDEVLSENLYWLPDSAGNYTFLQNLREVNIQAEATRTESGQIKLQLSNTADNLLAFFIRISLVNRNTGERILPVFYTDNYLSIEPGNEKTVFLDYSENINLNEALIRLEGWNVEGLSIPIK